jgi:hypothetical protein
MAKTVRVAETELKPAGPGSRKSFYRKAFVLDDLNGTRYLKSYDTVMCSADSDGYVRKYANIKPHSNATRRHVKSFLHVYAPGTSAKDFDGMEIEPYRPVLLAIN